MPKKYVDTQLSHPYVRILKPRVDLHTSLCSSGKKASEVSTPVHPNGFSGIQVRALYIFNDDLQKIFYTKKLNVHCVTLTGQ